MCLSACPHQWLGTRRAGDRHAELPGRTRTRCLCASLHKQLLQLSPAIQLRKTLCTRWMGFPQAQEPANWELSKVPAVFWEKISLSSAAPGGTLWAQKALLTGNKGCAACVRVVDTR